MFSVGYLEDEDVTPLSVLVGRMKKRKTSKALDFSAQKSLVEGHGDKAHCNGEVHGDQIKCDDKVQDYETQREDEMKGDETPFYVQMSDIDIQYDIGLGNTNTCFESTAEKILMWEEFIKEDCTLNLNSEVEELKECIYALKFLKWSMKGHGVVFHNKNVEVVGE